MKFIDIFAGIGTIRMGFEKAGHECVYTVEWDKHKRQIYEIIFGEKPQGSDINDIKASDFPRADVWCFGFPCQDISVAGKQMGFGGERSVLFFEVMRILSETKEEHKPKYLFIENVKNLLSIGPERSDGESKWKGFDFLEVLYQMDAIGYDAEWQLINSSGWVPQNRERTFIIGHLRGRSTKKVLPITRTSKKTLEQIIGGSQGQRVYSTNGISCTLSANGGGQGAKTGLHLVGNVNPNGVRITEATKKGYAIAKEGDSINLAFPSSKTRRGRVGKGVAQTLDRSCNQGTLVRDEVRRLTPKECWRLQGIPDEITDRVIAAGISDGQMYIGAGDGCTVEPVYEIAKKL